MCNLKDGDIGKDEVNLSILNKTDDKVDILNRHDDKVDILNISDRSPAQPFKPLNDSLTLTHDTFNRTSNFNGTLTHTVDGLTHPESSDQRLLNVRQNTIAKYVNVNTEIDSSETGEPLSQQMMCDQDVNSLLGSQQPE